jgi:hypothetical protein
VAGHTHIQACYINFYSLIPLFIGPLLLSSAAWFPLVRGFAWLYFWLEWLSLTVCLSLEPWLEWLSLSVCLSPSLSLEPSFPSGWNSGLSPLHVVFVFPVSRAGNNSPPFPQALSHSLSPPTIEVPRRSYAGIYLHCSTPYCLTSHEGRA